MFDDDPWRDAGLEADDDPPSLKPRHPWYEYAGLTLGESAERSVGRGEPSAET